MSMVVVVVVVNNYNYCNYYHYCCYYYYYYYYYYLCYNCQYLTLRLLMSYIYGAHIFDVSRSHTTTHHSR